MSDLAQFLEAVPNLATKDERCVDRFVGRLSSVGCQLLDRHKDDDHERTVLTLAAGPQALADGLLFDLEVLLGCIDMSVYSGAHPAVGALDVLPVVYLHERDRELARDEALGLANRIAAEHEVPIFLYGELATSPDRVERSFFRDGGIANLTERMNTGELTPDFGPPRPHPTAGATLVTARPPLVAFNVELAQAGLEDARSIASKIREAGGGLPGVRALGLHLEAKRIVQVSMNVHDPFAVPLGQIVAEVSQHAEPMGAEVVGAEIVGLVPRAALEGLDPALLRDFEPERHILENRVKQHGPKTAT